MGSSFFQEKPLEELVDVYDSLRKPVTASDRKPGPYPYYGASGITDYVDSFIFDGEYFLLSEDGDNLRTQNTPIAFMATEKFWVNNHAHILQANANNCTKYVCNALQIADVTSYISGSTRPKLNQKDMRRILVYAPPLPEQRAIAHILGSLDDKIELNRRMNETMEGMAQALFKSWFMDFDPVIDNALVAGNPIPEELADRAEVRRATLANGTANREAAKQFPAGFQQTEELGWIPRGWSIRPLPEVIDFLEGPGIRNWQYTDDEDGIKFINIRCIQDGDLKVDTASKLTRKEALGKYAHFQLSVDDIVISTSGTLGRYAFVRERHLPLSLNTSVIRFRKIDGISTLHFIAGFVDTQLQDELEMRATGSAQLNFGPMHLKQIQMLVPDDHLLKTHDYIADDIFRKRQTNLESNDALTKLRDTLLPKLISGELRIPEAEKLAEAALA